MSGKRILAAAALLLAFLSAATAVPGSTTLAQAGWSAPANISQSGDYDNAPAIAAAPDGSVTIAWDRRVPSNPTANLIIATANSGLGTPFRALELSRSEPQKTSGSVRIGRDSLGRRHVVWWQQDGPTVCDYYARIEADGRVSIREQVPDSCGASFKNTALGIGPDNSAHALFGRNLYNLYYWQRTDAGWVVRREQLPVIGRPEAPTLGVTTGGTVIAAWKDNAPKGNSDIYAGTRVGPGNWGVEDVSAGLTPGCEGSSKSDNPNLAADYTGGMRISWADERCDPRNLDPTYRDIYYREWAPGANWGGLPPVRVARTVGNAGENAITVDSGGTAHIAWTSTIYVTTINVYYAKGRGGQFSAQVAPFKEWAGGEANKDMAIAWSPGYIHMVFSSTRGDPLKENYYSYLPIGDTPPLPQPPSQPPAQPPPPPPGVATVPGSGSITFRETGRAVSGIFLDYWNAHGGLAQQGFPISGLMKEKSALDGKEYTVQYFERAVFEYHPEQKAPYDVLLAQLGTFRYKGKYPNGAPNQRPNTSPGSVLFPETGKRVGGWFLEYWRAHGGLAQQGFPISEEFVEVSDMDGKAYTVQYFERAVFELHPENPPPYDVLLSLLGFYEHNHRYGGR